MFGFSNKDDKWYKKLKKRYLKEKLNAPYENMFWYYDFVVARPYTKQGGCKSHFYFFIIAKEWSLTELTNDLNRILPIDLFENFCEALEEFNKLTAGLDIDELEWETEKELEKALKKFDDFANENYKPMENILKGLCDKEKTR